MEAAVLFTKLRVFGCEPNVFTYNTLIDGLCRTGHTIVALNLFEEMTNGNGEFGVVCEPNTVTCTTIIDVRIDDSDWCASKCFCL